MLAITALLASALALASLASAANHTVLVGGKAGLVFQPEVLDAAVGDFVAYIFQAKNHTVTQSGFAEPCKRLENATINAIGFASGFIPVADDATEFPAWTIEITEAKPIWFFCNQGNHCKQGMVGSINAAKTGDKTHEAFKALAMSGTAAPAASSGTVSFSATQSGVGASPRATSTASPADVSLAAAQANSSVPAGGAASSLSALSGAAALLSVAASFALMV